MARRQVDDDGVVLQDHADEAAAVLLEHAELVGCGALRHWCGRADHQRKRHRGHQSSVQFSHSILRADGHNIPTMCRLVSVFILFAVTALSAQQPAFKSGVELVTVPVTVTSLDHNTFIDGLTAADFRLSENGERQVITNVTRRREPLSLAIVVDSSGSMGLGIRKELAVFAVQTVFEGLLPDDQIAIVFFGEKVETRLPWTKVGDIKQLNWSGWVPYGSTPLNDGMKLGLRLIEEAQNPRRAVLLLTDGFENASRESTSSIVKSRQQSETTIFGVGVGSANLADLKAETPASGGSAKNRSRGSLRKT